MAREVKLTKEFFELVEPMEKLDVVMYTGDLSLRKAQHSLSKWQERKQLKGKRRTLVDEGILFVVRTK